MTGLHTRLFTRIISRNRETYLLKIVTLAVAFGSSVLILLFSFNEFGYDRFHNDPDAVFRILQRNTDDNYNGNRLSAKIPVDVLHRVKNMFADSLVTSRVKIMNEITVMSGDQTFFDQKVHAVDPSIVDIFSFEFTAGTAEQFLSPAKPVVLLSSSAAVQYTGTTKAAGKALRFYSFGDTVSATIAAVFSDFPKNSHEDFNLFLVFDRASIATLSFDPDESGVYGRILKSNPGHFESSLNRFFAPTKKTYRFQPLPELYFGVRVLGESARHGDSYSVIILISITGLILFLALTSYVNLTTLTLPYRSKELAVKKLAGIDQKTLLWGFLKESFAIVGISLAIGILALSVCSPFIEPILGLHILPLLLHGDGRLIFIVTGLFMILALSPVFLTLRFIRASPNRLLSTDTITFPKFKRVISSFQLGISIFLIVASVVVRRQINYSLLKEPGRNHDQVVYLNCPSGLTNEGIFRLRSQWKKFNPNILDVMAVSQLPDRISSKEIGSELYLLQVDRGFLEFFGFTMAEGRWFGLNDGDSIVVTNKKGRVLMGKNPPNVSGVIQDLNAQFNAPERPIKIKLAADFNYNWLCVRILEVDIRRTVNWLSEEFSTADKKANVHYLDSHFEDWLGYQDRLNVLSGILAIISGLLSCCAIYGLSVSLVRDKLKQIAVHKLCGAHTAHITRLLMMGFARQMLIALVIFGPVTYIFLHEMLRTFVYATKFNWLDPIYPIAYCACVITILCGFQALTLNRSDLTSALKG